MAFTTRLYSYAINPRHVSVLSGFSPANVAIYTPIAQNPTPLYITFKRKNGFYDVYHGDRRVILTSIAGDQGYYLFSSHGLTMDNIPFFIQYSGPGPISGVTPTMYSFLPPSIYSTAGPSLFEIALWAIIIAVIVGFFYQFVFMRTMRARYS
jgi:hypothetical protein